jgi:hypothetical protein
VRYVLHLSETLIFGASDLLKFRTEHDGHHPGRSQDGPCNSSQLEAPAATNCRTSPAHGARPKARSRESLYVRIATSFSRAVGPIGDRQLTVMSGLPRQGLSGHAALFGILFPTDLDSPSSLSWVRSLRSWRMFERGIQAGARVPRLRHHPSR